MPSLTLGEAEVLNSSDNLPILEEGWGSNARCLEFSTVVVETFKTVLSDTTLSSPERTSHIDILYTAAGAMAMHPDIEGFRQGLSYPPAAALLIISELTHVALKPDEVRILHRWAVEEAGYPSATPLP